MKNMKLCMLMLILCSCANQFSASTEASFKNGEWYYKSYKNQENLDASISLDKNGNPQAHISTSATTPEAAIAAAAKSLGILIDGLNKLLPVIEKAALAGGS